MDAGVTMIRHLLLALFLLGLSLPSVTSPLQPEAIATDCHGAMPVDSSPHQPDGEGNKAAAHICIGCIASTPAAAAASASMIWRRCRYTACDVMSDVTGW